jgi:hypothetical protein
MITVNQPSFLVLGENEQTPKKVKQGVIKFQTPIKGKITSWITFEDETGNEVTNVFITEYNNDYFVGEKLDILLTLHTNFKTILEELNPNLTFTIKL